jgi:hypothetical protein
MTRDYHHYSRSAPDPFSFVAFFRAAIILPHPLQLPVRPFHESSRKRRSLVRKTPDLRKFVVAFAPPKKNACISDIFLHGALGTNVALRER